MNRRPFLLLLCLLTVACGHREATCTDCLEPDAPVPAEGYVSLVDGHFAIDGQPWFPLMLNYKAFIDGDRVVPAPWYTDGDVRAHFDTIASWGFNAVRVCLDVLPSDADTALMYAATRRMVQQADSAGLRVMLLIKPPLDDYWSRYAAGLMRRLADLPALWAYDLMNEPLYFDPEPNRDKCDAASLVCQWRKLVRQHAPHQLFTLATAEPIEAFEWDPSLLAIDFVEMHTYHPLRVQSEMWWYAHYCGKPWMVGETGLPADNDSVPYTAQAQFMHETYRYALAQGAIGYGWWEFQDYPQGVNYEAQFTGLRTVEGQRKPAVATLAQLQPMPSDSAIRAWQQPPVGYRNMLAYENMRIDGRVVDPEGNGIEGAVVRGWNEDWSVGINTFTDSEGHFGLVSNDECTHFEISAAGYSKIKFDRHIVPHPLANSLPNRTREYQGIPLLGWGSANSLLPSDPTLFDGPDRTVGTLGALRLHRLRP